MDFLPPCESAASHYRVGLVSFGSGCVPVFQGGVFECSSRMKGNFQVRFLEGRVPAMAPGYSTVIPQDGPDRPRERHSHAGSLLARLRPILAGSWRTLTLQSRRY